MRQQIAQSAIDLAVGLARIVRMHAHRREDLGMPVSEPDRSLQIRRTAAGSDGQHSLHARIKSPRDGVLAVGVELLTVQMAMRIDKRHYFRRAPIGISSRTPASTGFPPSSDAATIIPFDVRPRSLRGCRFATITTLRPM